MRGQSFCWIIECESNFEKSYGETMLVFDWRKAAFCLDGCRATGRGIRDIGHPIAIENFSEPFSPKQP